MKTTWYKTPMGQIRLGVLGFILSTVLALIAEFWVAAPDASTLYYRQSQVLGAALVVFIISFSIFGVGLWYFFKARISMDRDK